MKRIALPLAGLAALVLAAAGSSASGATVVIKHESRGCHSWSVNGGPFRASQTARVAAGARLTVVDDDVMPHLLVQLKGPAKASLSRISNGMHDMKTDLKGPGLMAHMGASVSVRFPKAGTYVFGTKAGEDYTSGIKTVGEDHVLKLRVVVA